MESNENMIELNNFFTKPKTTNFEKNNSITELEKLYNNEPTSHNKGLFFILIQAIKYKASDIHFENHNNGLKIRFRINGLLKTYLVIDNNYTLPIFSKIKILSNLDIIEKRKTQDGRFSLIYDNREIDFRTSVIPTLNGEKIVIRLLDKFNYNFSIEDLHLNSKNYEYFMKALNQNSGIILINGPTGSGKSTTLYSALKYKNSPEINICTVEDPIEYQIDGVNQCQCRNDIGLTFSTLLRALLRQDPDILMIGEIRDKDTAEIAIKAALTGHLIFSTLHSNDFLGCLNRLINFNLDPYLLSSVLLMIISQRLVRTLCPHCKKVDENYEKKLKILNYSNINLQDKKFYTHSDNGCEKCFHTGYNGRIPIFEIVYFDENLKKKFFTKGIDAFLNIQNDKLIDDGINKALNGITSLDEIMRQI